MNDNERCECNKHCDNGNITNLPLKIKGRKSKSNKTGDYCANCEFIKKSKKTTVDLRYTD